MRIRSTAPKVLSRGLHRECTAEQTYARVAPHLARAGVTDIEDITGLDRLGIPVFAAVCPHAIDGADGYYGKGLTRDDARTSAAMEALERFAGWLPVRPAVIASTVELAAAGRPAVRPHEHTVALHPQYRDDRPIYWVAGHDLMHDEPVLLPHGAACYGVPAGAPPCYQQTTTNGLASGNTLEEATCHALCEVLERDAMTLAEVVGQRLPRMLAERGKSTVDRAAALTKLAEQRPRIDLATVPPAARALVARYHRAGVEVAATWVASELGVPTIRVATPAGHVGSGAHPDAETALIRALTECAQGRAVDILAHGEHVTRPDADQTREDDGWADRPETSWDDLPSYPSDDIAVDVNLMLDRVRRAGLSRVVVVDLSPPEIPVHVVRVVVPGLESWTVGHSRIGERATAAWNQAIASLGVA